jgi:TolB-like protein/DNA-binding winged helix-turn-helix (wHTH) protein/Tfp pilus assembly protein PilF
MRLDLRSTQLWIDNQHVELRPQSFQVLKLLVQNRDNLVSKKQILDEVWGDTIVTDDSLTQCVTDIRRAIADHDKRIIRTVPRQGYFFTSMLEELSEETPRRHNHVAAALAVAGLIVIALLSFNAVQDDAADVAAPTSVAVLPFDDLTADQNMKYLADGLAEEILNLLTFSRDLRVIARTSSFAIANSSSDIQSIGEKLDVEFVLKGSVRQGGDRLRITANLVRVADNSQLWSQSYDRKLGDILVIEQDIASSVSSALEVELEIPRSPSGSPDPLAHAMVVQARALIRFLGDENNAMAKSLLKQALEIDPDNVEALLELARAVLHTRGRSGEEGFREAWLRSIELTDMALAIDPQHPVANAWRGYQSLHYSQNYRSAARYLERAMSADSRSADVLNVVINGSIVFGRYDLAVELGRYAILRDPLCIECYTKLSLAALLAGDYRLAEESIQKAISIVPGESGWNFDGHLARIRLWQGDARGTLDILDSLDDPSSRSLEERAVAYAMLGQNEEFEAVRKEMVERYHQRAPESIAAVEAAAGNVDSAFLWLQRNASRPSWERGLNIGVPYFASLHDDPRWQAYLDEIGLADDQRQAIEFNPRMPH